jgi:tetratricopeptide (TPR) repeat protein
MVHLIAGDDSPRAARVYADLLHRIGALGGDNETLARHIALGVVDRPNRKLAWVAALLTQPGLTESQVHHVCLGFLDALAGAVENTADLATSYELITSVQRALDRLVAQDPGSTERKRLLSKSVAMLGDVQRGQGNLSGALESCRTSLALSERVAAQDLDFAYWQRRDPAERLGKVGDVQFAQGDLSGALESYRASLAMIDHLAAQDPSDAEPQHDRSWRLNRVGEVQSAQGNLSGALESYRASLALHERLAAQDPGSVLWQRDLSVGLNKVGGVQSTQGNLSGALESYRASLAIVERLAAQDPGSAKWQRDLPVSLNHVGDVQRAQGNLSGARESCRASLAIVERLAAQDPGNAEWQQGLSVSLVTVGDVQSAQGNRSGALESYRASLAIFEGLAAQDPGNAEWQRNLSVSYARMGASQETEDEASKWLRKAYDVLGGLRRRGLFLSAQDEQVLAQLRAKVEGGTVPTTAGADRRASPAVSVPTPHPRADPEGAARPNIEHHAARRQWEALPWWKRLLTKRPEPPTGI